MYGKRVHGLTKKRIQLKSLIGRHVQKSWVYWRSLLKLKEHHIQVPHRAPCVEILGLLEESFGIVRTPLFKFAHQKR